MSDRDEIRVYSSGSATCSHEWKYVNEYDEFERRCGLCHRREAMWQQEALDNDEWREFCLPLIDPRA